MMKVFKENYSYQIGKVFDRSKPELCSKDEETGFLTVCYNGNIFQLDSTEKQVKKGKETLIHAIGCVRFQVNSCDVISVLKTKRNE